MNVLSIGGSDPSSGAGIQSDVKTFENHGVYGFTVITAITSQNTKKISKILPISSKNIKSQLESILSDFHIDAIKIGMVYDSSFIKAVYAMIKNQKCPIVVDPIIESTTKTVLLKKSAVSDYNSLRECGASDWQLNTQKECRNEDAGDTYYCLYQLDGNYLYPNCDSSSTPSTSSLNTDDESSTFVKQ